MLAADLPLAERLAELLDSRASADGATIAAWRFDLGVGRSIGVGIKDGSLGGPYEPPSAARVARGSLHLHWSDGLVSTGSIDQTTVPDFESQLRGWRAHAYADPDAPDVLPPPESLPAVVTADRQVGQAVDQDPEPLFGELTAARDRLRRAGDWRIDADAGVSAGTRAVYSSTGLRVAYVGTAASLSLSADDLYWRTFEKRRLPTAAELDELIENVAETMLVLGRTAEAPRGEQPVLLRPGLAMSFLGRFLLANLGARGLTTGRSAFTLDDVREGRRVGGAELTVVLNSLLDLESAASPISSEGVPGGRAVIVDRGRLARPVADLKYAAKTGFPPTPVPAGSPGAVVETLGEPVETVRQEIGEGLELSTVLGLHGQDPTAGRYSLVSPQARVLRSGQPLGRARVLLAGSFLEHLLDPRTRFVRYPWGMNPGMVVWTRVEAG
jgi:predicted Zn-dependent protease